nr:GNAT family N-acetyltransferase [Aeromicrobium sp. CFBP 8757]
MITIADQPDLRRFEARDEGTLVGFADYIRTDELIVFTHTEVDTAWEGHGVGSRLAEIGIRTAEHNHLRVLAICTFIASWMARHPEFAHLEYRSTSAVTD